MRHINIVRHMCDADRGTVSRYTVMKRKKSPLLWPGNTLFGASPSMCLAKKRCRVVASHNSHQKAFIFQEFQLCIFLLWHTFGEQKTTTMKTMIPLRNCNERKMQENTTTLLNIGRTATCQ